jgi:hypothetical protein
MKIVKITLLTVVSFLLMNSQASAQDYETAVGGRLGYGLIGSYKKFLDDAPALEFIAGFGLGSVGVGVLGGAFYQHHMDISEIDRLRWYVGGGAIANSFSYSFTSTSYFELTAAFSIGLDYSFEDIPLNISLDYTPGFVVLSSLGNFNDRGVNRFRGQYGSLSARYILQY